LREWHSTQPPSRVKPYLQRLFEATDPVVCVAACRVDGAHYREPRRDDKGFFTKKTRSLRYAAKRFYFARITTILGFHWI
ncbi:hypothetical protein, partial [Aeromonas hydrophila]|uniref:hypothetical protein n=1 Tax=Aeromonas hydrophila TaxID=644 RepID=UPI0030174DA0